MGKTFLQKYLARNRYNYYMYMYPKKFLLHKHFTQMFYKNNSNYNKSKLS